MESTRTTRILCDAFLAADVVTLVLSAKDKPDLGFSMASLIFHGFHGLFAILNEIMREDGIENESVAKIKRTFRRLSRNLGFPLMATQIAYGPIHEPWIPVINLFVPLTDIVMYYVMEEKPFDEEMVQLSKMISIGCMVYASMKSEETLGYIAAAAYLLAELTPKYEGDEGWCFLTAIGDYMSTLILYGTIFGYSKGELGA